MSLAGLEVAGLVGVVGDEDGLAVETSPGVLEVEDLLDSRGGLGERAGGDPSEGEVGEEVVAVDGGVEGIGGGPEEGGLREGSGEEVLPGGSGEEALGVVGGVAEEEEVAGSGASVE
jgi:hypothetical protein